MVQRNRYIQRGQQQAHAQREPAQDRQRPGDQPMVVEVGGHAHEIRKAHRRGKGDRQPVDQNAHAPLEQIAGEAVGPLGVQQLREGRVRRVDQRRLERPRGGQRVDIQRVEPRAQRLGERRVRRALEKEQRDARVRHAPDARLHDLQRGRGEPAPHQRRVHAQRLHKGVARALDGLLERRLRDRAGAGAAHLEAHRAAHAVKQQQAAAVGEVVHGLVQRVAPLRRPPSARRAWVSGRMIVSDTSAPSTSPSSQQTRAVRPSRRPRLSARIWKSAQETKTARSASAVRSIGYSQRRAVCPPPALATVGFVFIPLRISNKKPLMQRQKKTDNCVNFPVDFSL